MAAIEVIVDEAGNIHPADQSIHPPAGKALLVWDQDNADLYPALMSSKSFEDWDTPEEDEAWAYLQRVK